jgi:ankyrin repeat protein
MASNLGHAKMVAMLLSKGGDPNVTNEGFSALQYAVAGHTEIVKMLVEKGAEINKADPNGYYPLHHAATHGSIEIVKYLLSKGADTKVKGYNGETPAECTKNNKVRKLLESQSSK